uniref:Uncharacterized protein n=1 Tax=Marinobacter nauticus TaxID=2743 RepID=A0A455W5Y7_MARNT|nr:hypothetical protein YBY_22700 [Marinobacter nauticus]
MRWPQAEEQGHACYERGNAGTQACCYQGSVVQQAHKLAMACASDPRSESQSANEEDYSYDCADIAGPPPVQRSFAVLEEGADNQHCFSQQGYGNKWQGRAQSLE